MKLAFQYCKIELKNILNFFTSPEDVSFFICLICFILQAYHEEMLEWSPKREYLNKYAHQLVLLYPSQRDQVSTRMQTLNNLWQVIEAVITPQQGVKNVDCMLQGLYFPQQ